MKLKHLQPKAIQKGDEESEKGRDLANSVPIKRSDAAHLIVISLKQLLQFSCGCDIWKHHLSSPDLAEKSLLVVEADGGQIQTTGKRVMTTVAGRGSDSRFNQIRCSVA